MANRVLILGGQGRIGSSVARDLHDRTSAILTLTGRTPKPIAFADVNRADRTHFLALDLDNETALSAAIEQNDLVIHCAGPFKYRDGRVLQICIDLGVNYLDVSDNREFVSKALDRRADATAAGITAIVSSGVFPGISNSMARQGIEQLDEAEEIHLSYVVAGSGGAGITVMRTTFLELQHPFDAWIEGQWRQVKPYCDRERIPFPPPYGPSAVYWFSTSEAFTLARSFPVKTVVTKFGSVPDFYNHLTWLTAHWTPQRWLQHPAVVEFLARVSYQMTVVTDRFSGTGIAMRAAVTGQKDGQPACYCSTLVHPDTAIAAGHGTGSIAQLLLSGQLQKPGVWPVEQALPTNLFEYALKSRGIEIFPMGKA